MAAVAAVARLIGVAFFCARSNGHGCWRSAWGTDIQEKEETVPTEER